MPTTIVWFLLYLRNCLQLNAVIVIFVQKSIGLWSCVYLWFCDVWWPFYKKRISDKMMNPPEQRVDALAPGRLICNAQLYSSSQLSTHNWSTLLRSIEYICVIRGGYMEFASPLSGKKRIHYLRKITIFLTALRTDYCLIYSCLALIADPDCSTWGDMAVHTI